MEWIHKYVTRQVLRWDWRYHRYIRKFYVKSQSVPDSSWKITLTKITKSLGGGRYWAERATAHPLLSLVGRQCDSPGPSTFVPRWPPVWLTWPSYFCPSWAASVTDLAHLLSSLVGRQCDSPGPPTFVPRWPPVWLTWPTHFCPSLAASVTHLAHPLMSLVGRQCDSPGPPTFVPRGSP